MVNWAEAHLTDILVSCRTACFGVLKSEGEKHCLAIATFNTLSCFSHADNLSYIHQEKRRSFHMEGGRRGSPDGDRLQ